MLKYLVRRLLFGLPTLVGISVIVFDPRVYAGVLRAMGGPRRPEERSGGPGG